jgi:ABC-type transporter Mla MlaB component
MNLTISNYNSYFKMKGILDRNTIHVFHEEFRNIFRKVNSVTISVEDIVSMDRYGVNAIAELHNEALAKNKKLAIIGLGCKDLYEHFKSAQAA